jgi:hypothetical protein
MTMGEDERQELMAALRRAKKSLYGCISDETDATHPLCVAVDAIEDALSFLCELDRRRR